MKKEERIKKYGEGAWEKKLQQMREWYSAHPREAKVNHQETSCKGGKHYEKTLQYNSTGLRGKRNVIRVKHANCYRPYKQLIAPESQIHHEWLPNSANYQGVALVEKDQHMHGIIDVIQILEGEITLLTEAEIKTGGAE